MTYISMERLASESEAERFRLADPGQSPDTPAGVLAALAKDRSFRVREAVCAHLNSPASALRILANHPEHWDSARRWLSDFRDPLTGDWLDEDLEDDEP